MRVSTVKRNEAWAKILKPFLRVDARGSLVCGDLMPGNPSCSHLDCCGPLSPNPETPHILQVDEEKEKEEKKKKTKCLGLQLMIDNSGLSKASSAADLAECEWMIFHWSPGIRIWDPCNRAIAAPEEGEGSLARVGAAEQESRMHERSDSNGFINYPPV